jgi:hypothetical protein
MRCGRCMPGPAMTAYGCGFPTVRRDVAVSYAEHLASATDHHLAMVAVVCETVIGVASAELNPTDAECAEVAVLVDDGRQHGLDAQGAPLWDAADRPELFRCAQY